MNEDKTLDELLGITPEEKEAMIKKAKDIMAKCKAILSLMDFLEIPYSMGGAFYQSPPTINTFDLYDILMDEEKLRVLVSKLRNKAFW